MEVYIEDIFIDNFIINFILLYTTAKIMHLDAKWWQLELSTILGV
ncbi:MAG: sigma-E processing peptidase SpoIIGA, partial [Clostridia bacterium]|nr:sigma-E processing peptidase SpoIIGA [Clostridia bacterium]